MDGAPAPDMVGGGWQHIVAWIPSGDVPPTTKPKWEPLGHATISGIGIAGDWAWRVDAPGVRATVVDEHVHSPFHNLLA
jgi:hypothetical protein